MQKKYLALYIYIDHHHYHNLQPTDLLKKVKIFRLPTGSQTDLLEMVKNFRYPLGSQLTFLIKEVKSFRYTQAFGDFANTRTDTQTPRWHCIQINIMHIRIKTLKVLQVYLAIHLLKNKIQRITSISDFVGLKRVFPALFISKEKVIQSIASISGSGVLFVPASAGLVENTDRLMSASY